MKILLLDIETSPNTAFVWGLFKENIPIQRLIESSRVLCWAAKWHGEREVMFDSIHKSSEKRMLKGIHKLLDEADAVVHYNGTSFDIPTLNKEFLLHDLQPPSPAKQIDLLQTCRDRFRFPSNRLDYVSQSLGLGKKHSTDFEMWVKCMNKDDVSWARMEKYNKQDVKLLEKLYDKLKPWIRHHPNHGLYSKDVLCCPNCGGKSYQRRGEARTQTCIYVRFQCTSTGCGKWFRSTRNIGPVAGKKFTGLD